MPPPPQVLAVLEKLLKEMREGKRDKVIVWGPLEGKMTVTGYYALRDKEGKYLGCMEVDQDITEIQKLEGSSHKID